jgi:hypothetical protein
MALMLWLDGMMMMMMMMMMMSIRRCHNVVAAFLGASDGR